MNYAIVFLYSDNNINIQSQYSKSNPNEKNKTIWVANSYYLENIIKWILLCNISILKIYQRQTKNSK